MASRTEEEIKEALEGVLKLYNIKLEEPLPQEGNLNNSYAEMMGKGQAKLDELTEKAEEIYRRTGMTREQLEAYASNPNNFTPEQWEALKKVREACERYKREARAQIGDPQFEQKVQTQEKEKQSKRFAKRKNWIPL